MNDIWKKSGVALLLTLMMYIPFSFVSPSSALVNDETMTITSIFEPFIINPLTLRTHDPIHPFLGFTIVRLGSNLFNCNIQSMRATINFILFFFICYATITLASEVFKRKYTAIFAVLATTMSYSFFELLFTRVRYQYQLNLILTLFSILFIVRYLKSNDIKELNKFLLFSILNIMTLATSYISLSAAIVTYFFVVKHSTKRIMQSYTKSSKITQGIFISLLLLVLFWGSSYLLSIVGHTNEGKSIDNNILIKTYDYTKAYIDNIAYKQNILGIFFPVALILSVIFTKYTEKKWFSVYLIVVIFFQYLASQMTFLPIPRGVLFFIPLLYLGIGNSIPEILAFFNIPKKNLFNLIVLSSILCLGCFAFLQNYHRIQTDSFEIEHIVATLTKSKTFVVEPEHLWTSIPQFTQGAYTCPWFKNMTQSPTNYTYMRRNGYRIINSIKFHNGEYSLSPIYAKTYYVLIHKEHLETKQRLDLYQTQILDNCNKEKQTRFFTVYFCNMTQESISQ